MQNKVDYVVIGSGFGGSVAALRLAEKGYSVLVIEKGKWYNAKDFPKTNWQLSKWLWLPAFRFFGIMKLTYYRHIAILSGVGVGGGSLVYANTLPKPKALFFQSGSWANLADWQNELDPFYDKALKMLGATKNPRLFDADNYLQKVAQLNGKEQLFEPTNVAVFFGDDKPNILHKDPYFDGKGPERMSCNHCGKCMTGCPNNAKNTLDKNYLYLAQQLGVNILAENEVIDVKPNNDKTYNISYKSSTQYFSTKRTIQAKGVVFAGGVLGTVSLLLKLKKKSMPNISDMLGKDIRSNNEALIAVSTADTSKDFTQGVAIGSIINLDENTHVEPCRYGTGSGFWRTVMMPSVNEPNFIKRIVKLLFIPIKEPMKWLKIATVKDFAKQTPILLFMQNLDSTLQFKLGFLRMKTTMMKGKAPTAFIPEAHHIAKQYADAIGGKPMSIFSETITGIPSTAHILGGAVMGSDATKGVIDKNNKLFGYDNIYVCDGSVISANPGVNPSLSITAIAERAMYYISEKR
jgi:cholesterol oxidase